MNIVWIILLIIFALVFFVPMVFGYAVIIWKSFKEAKRLGKDGEDEFGMNRKAYLWMGFVVLAWVVFIFFLITMTD